MHPREIIEFKQKQSIEKTIWTFPISLMASWRPLHSAQLEDCFETDWANTRIPKILKGDENDITNIK